MYKILAVIALVLFVSTAASVSIIFFSYLDSIGVGVNGMLAIALAIIVLSIPPVVKAGDFLEELWNHG